MFGYSLGSYREKKNYNNKPYRPSYSLYGCQHIDYRGLFCGFNFVTFFLPFLLSSCLSIIKFFSGRTPGALSGIRAELGTQFSSICKVTGLSTVYYGDMQCFSYFNKVKVESNAQRQGMQAHKWLIHYQLLKDIKQNLQRQKIFCMYRRLCKEENLYNRCSTRFKDVQIKCKNVMPFYLIKNWCVGKIRWLDCVCCI